MDFANDFTKTTKVNTLGLKKMKIKPSPIYDNPKYNYKNNRLKNKVAIVTGGDSGIGGAVCVSLASSGCDICVVYLNGNYRY